MKTKCTNCIEGSIEKKYSVYDPYHRKDIIVTQWSLCPVCGGSGFVGEEESKKEKKEDRLLDG
jgi:hypothetical protein